MNMRSIRFRLGAWYAGLLALLLLAFGGFVYFTLYQFLERSLQDTLSKEAQTIGQALLSKIRQTGEAFVVDEIEEHSGRPQDGTFEPQSVAFTSSDEPSSWREEPMASGKKLFVYSMTYLDGAGMRYSIQAGASSNQIDQVLRELLLSLAVALPLIVGAAMGGGFLLTRSALRPLDRIATIAEKITSRNLNERVPETDTGDEVAKLAVSLNRMMIRLEESFHQVNRFSADVSHEIRTPLAILRAELEDVLKTQELKTESRDSIASALEEAERLSDIAEQLLEMTRLEAGEMLSEPALLDIADLTRNAVDQMRVLADEKNVRLIYEGTSGLNVLGDPIRLRQVVVNLIDNAIKYTPPGGSISVSSSRSNGKAILAVADTGIGIPSEALPYVFERFYRVDGARSRQLGGTGLGLAIVKSICSAFGGDVTVQSVIGSGTTFRVELPLESDM
jgi:heavy metal sensor kinase